MSMSRLVPPFQAFQELNWEAKQTCYNPRYFHTFQDEDTIGNVKQVCRAVHRRLLELRVLGRWLLRLKTYSQGRTNQPLRRSGWIWRKKIVSEPKTQPQNSYMTPGKKLIYECRFWALSDVLRSYGGKYFWHLWMLYFNHYAGVSGFGCSLPRQICKSSCQWRVLPLKLLGKIQHLRFLNCSFVHNTKSSFLWEKTSGKQRSTSQDCVRSRPRGVISHNKNGSSVQRICQCALQHTCLRKP